MRRTRSAFNPTRRRLVQSAAAWTLTALSGPQSTSAASRLRFPVDPFLLGVASGSATADSLVLWTRLITSPDAPLDARDQAIPVEWELAGDSGMRKVIRRGVEYAAADWAHSVHVDVSGLSAGRDYWYRFVAGGQRSPIGRTRTLPPPNARVERIRFAVACCQNYEHGYYTAYRYMLDDALDFVVHCGDYIYETAAGDSPVRSDGSGEAITLDQYRARYALYKSDPDLKAAHAAYPWFVTWDDHEVVNDYAGDSSYDQVGAAFLRRRAAAYRAYYEHMPLPRNARPHGPNMQLFGSRRFGTLLQLHMLDSRQYRSPLACLGPGDNEGAGADCPELFDTKRTKLGYRQEAWLKEQLAASDAHWNVMVQGTPMAHVDLDPGPGVAYRRDAWDGYPVARQRFIDTLVDTGANNPIVIDGDIHAFQIANLNARANDSTSPIVASELTTTSISSGGPAQADLDARRRANPNVLLSDSTKHGYLLVDVAQSQTQSDLVTVDSVRRRAAERGLLARYGIEAGKPGPIKL